jgi:hypothetical protein
MVRAITLGAALACLTAAGAHAQIDLTPTESFYEVEGIRMPNVTFRNSPKPVTYTPPADWTLQGGRNKLTLIPRDSIQAGAIIETQPLPPGGPLPAATAQNIKYYSDLAVTLVPREASKVEVVEAVVSPIRISGKAMIEVTMTYSFFGQQYRMNVLFMPREKEELRFQFASRNSDYAALSKAFRSSLFTMQGL